MSKVLERLKAKRERRMKEYDEAKREFEEVLRKPAITVTIELPKRLEDLETEFLLLERDETFLKAVEKLAEKYLKRKKRASERKGLG